MMSGSEMAEEDEKVLCASLLTKEDKTVSWFAMDPRSDADASKNIVEFEKMRTPNGFHDRITFYGTAVLGSKVYLIGGNAIIMYRAAANDVSVYDTIQGTWSKGPCLNVSRFNMVAVIVFRTKIYVFGTQRWPIPPLSIYDWVECYDTASVSGEEGHWVTIPGPPNVDQLEFSKMGFDVVHFRQEVRFVGSEDHQLYVFDLLSDTWMPTSSNFSICDYPFPPPPPHCDYFKDNHLVYGNYAIWHLYGDLYYWDLTTNKQAYLCNLPDDDGWWAYRRPGGKYDYDVFPQTGHLIHLGNGLVSIVHYAMLEYDTPSVECYTFQIIGDPFQTSSKDGACHLCIGSPAIRRFLIPGTNYLFHAFALPAGLLTMGTKKTQNRSIGSKRKRTLHKSNVYGS